MPGTLAAKRTRGSRSRPRLTWEAEEFLPRNGACSEYEFFHLPTNRGIEYVDGHLEVLPVPDVFHQIVQQNLNRELDWFAVRRRAGKVLTAGVKVLLRARKYREPDLAFMLAENSYRIHSKFWIGADLLVEIVSPDNPPRDYKVKRREYARAGVLEYWIVDPRKCTILVLKLEGETYEVHGEFKTGQKATSALLPGFSVEVNKIFAEG